MSVPAIKALLPFSLVTALFIGATVSAIPARAAELVMFKAPGCTWCEVWEKELGGVYPKTTEGKQAPLRRITLSEQKGMSGLELPVRRTPTFVLMDKGEEIGRIQGYPGEEFFWVMLDDLLSKLKKSGS